MLFLQFPQLSIDAYADWPADQTTSILVEWVATTCNRNVDVVQVDEVGQSIFFQSHNVAELRLISMDQQHCPDKFTKVRDVSGYFCSGFTKRNRFYDMGH